MGSEKSYKPKLKKSPRKCIVCGETFDSIGMGNRVCPRCKPKASYNRYQSKP